MKWSVRNVDISSSSKKRLNELSKILAVNRRSHLLIVGLGNEFRSDDSAGLCLIDLLSEEKLPPEWELLKCYENPENYLGILSREGIESILFFDTVTGTDERLEIYWGDEINDFSLNTHSFGLSSIVEYIKNIRNISVFLIGMKPYDMSLKTGISEEMGKTVSILLKGFENLWRKAF